jgi:SAM-dependent methyltransferase
MGRWSRLIAAEFLPWLAVADGQDWLEVGCGTGALTNVILARNAPTSILAIDASDGFVDQARAAVTSDRATFRVGNAMALDVPPASRDVVVSGLVLNFVPDRAAELAGMAAVARPGGTVGFYVWDYPNAGVGFMAAFWRAAVALNPAAAELRETVRFADCTEMGLVALARRSGLGHVRSRAIEVATVFADFDDLWVPFTLGTGPAPGYCASLDPTTRDALRAGLRQQVTAAADGRIHLTARAWAVAGTVG